MKKAITLLIVIAGFLGLLAQDYYGTIQYDAPVQVNDLDTAKTVQIHPDVAINKLFNGDIMIYAAWEDDTDGDGVYEIYYSTSSDTGKTFSADICLTDSINNSCRYPSLASDNEGNVFIVFQVLEGGTWEIYITSNTGMGFTVPGKLTGVNVNNNENSEVNFGPQPIVLCDSKSHVDSNFVYVLFQNEGALNTVIDMARSIDTGASFNLQKTVNARTGVNRHPNGYIDDSGNIHIVYEGGSGTNMDPHPNIFYSLLTERGDSTVITDAIVNDNSAESSRRLNPDCIYDEKKKRIYVSWEDSRTSAATNDDAPCIFMAFADSSAPDSFSVNIRGDVGTGSYDFRPSLSIDYKGNLVTAWYGTTAVSDSVFRLFMNVYNDSMGMLGAEELKFSYAGNSAANFGNNFYRPALLVDAIDSVPVFYVSWRDKGITNDENGDIFFVRGVVMAAFADIDIDDDNYDVYEGIINYDTIPAGPAYMRKYFLIACTDDSLNPDVNDGPGNIGVDTLRVDSLVLQNTAGDRLNNYVINNLPSSMDLGASAIVEFILYIPEGFEDEQFSGHLFLSGTGENFAEYYESVAIEIHGGNSEDDYDSLKVFPNPVDGRDNENTVYFYGLTSDSRIQIMDYTGHVLASESEINADGLISIDVSDLKGGLYFFVIYDNENVYKGKLSILR